MQSGGSWANLAGPSPPARLTASETRAQTMPRYDAERLADALWRSFRSTLVEALDVVVAAHEDSDPAAQLDAAVEARASAWAAKRRERQRQQRQAPAKRHRAAPSRRVSS